MEKFFKLKERGTDVRTEIVAGLTTFMAMAYILMVNANMFADPYIQICLSRVRARRPGAGRGYGVQRIRGTGAGSPDPLALAERAENGARR